MPPARPNKSAARQLQEQREHSLREREAQSRRVDETRAANMSAAAKAAAAMVRKAGAEREGAAVASRQATVGLPAGASPATPAKEAYGNSGSVRRSVSSSSKEGFVGSISRSSGGSDASRIGGSGSESAKRDSAMDRGRTSTMRSVASVASVASAVSAAPGRATRGSGRPNGATGNGARAAASAWKKPQDKSDANPGVSRNPAGIAAAQASKNADSSGEDAEFKRRSAAAAARMSSQKKIDIAPRASTRDSMLANFSDALKWLKDDEEADSSQETSSAMASALASGAGSGTGSGPGSGTGSGPGSGTGSGPGSQAGSATASVAGSVAASGAVSTASRNSQDAPRQAARQSAHVAIPHDQRQPVAGDSARNALAAATLAKTNVDATVGMINDRVNERINKRNRKLKMYQPSAVWTGYDPLREASRNEQRDQAGALLPAAHIVSGGQHSQPRDVWPPPDDTDSSHHHALHMPSHGHGHGHGPQQHQHKQVFAAPNEIVAPRPRPMITLTNENLNLPRPRTHSPAVVRPRSLGAPPPDVARTPPTPNGLFPSETWLPLYQAARSAENLAVPDYSPSPHSPQVADDDASRQRYSFEGYFRPPDPVQSQQHHHHHHHHHHRGGRILGRVLRPSHRRAQSSASDSRDHSTERPAVPAMKATMRDANKTRQRFNEDKPWKHHTHATALTERERKRYEGVWATNKGTYVKYLYSVSPLSPSSPVPASPPPPPPPNDDHDSRTGLPPHRPRRDPADQVHAIAVRDIWRRSRLSDETLGHIWDLVDHNYDGTLDRPSFVVGMWLVDQCLYGRKLPAKIDQTIWNSVALLHVDVKVKAKKKQAHKSGADDKTKREGRPKTRSKHK